MMNREVEINNQPQRIVSLVPSQTELLFDLGLDKEIIGITNFCTRPKHWRSNKTLIGGTKALNLEKIKALNPDLIIGNKEENKQEEIEELTNSYPVWLSDIYTLEDAYKMIKSIGEISNKAKKAQYIKQQIQAAFQALQIQKKVTGLYLIWAKPFMAAGKKTFINAMLDLAGIQNLASEESRYPELSMEEIKSLNPEVLLLSSEPYPFKEKNRQEIQELFPKSKVMLVDGEAFSWYGSRLVQSPYIFQSIQGQI